MDTSWVSGRQILEAIEIVQEQHQMRGLMRGLYKSSVLTLGIHSPI